MNFKIKKEFLLNELNILQKGLPNKTPLPILNAIKFDVYEDEIVLTSTNSDIIIQTTIKADNKNIKKTGSFAINGKKLFEIIKRLETEIVEFQLPDPSNLRIISELAQFDIRLYDVEEYPTNYFLDSESFFDFDIKEFQNIIRQTNFAAGEDEKRIVLTGVHFYNKGRLVYVVASNGYRLSQKRFLLNQEIDDFDFVIPKKSLEELSKIIDLKQSETIKIVYSKNYVLFKFSNILFQTRLLEGRYPNTEAIIPNDFLIEIPFNKENLKLTIERASVLGFNKEKEKFNIIKLSLNKDKTVYISSANTEIGEFYEQVNSNGEITGDEITISFSASYLLDALRSFIGPNVVLKFLNNKKPFTIISKDDANLLQVVLPVSLN